MAVRKLVCPASNLPAQFSTSSPHGKIAATDQRFFVNHMDIPAIVWGPGSPSQAHTVDEWARIDFLEDAVPILCRAIEELLVED